MKRKILSILMGVAMVATLLSGCGGSKDADGNASGTEGEKKDASTIKVGIIYVGDENEGYTAAHMAGIKEMAAEYGISTDRIIEKTCIKEDESCYDAAVDLADQGCDVIFGNSFGHEDYLIRAAKEYKDVEFCHATGYQAASSGLTNMHNYFDNIFEARYVSGVVAGMKLQEMIDNGTITKEQAKMGYVGAFPYAEVVSGYTAFYLGAKSIVDSVTMEVRYTNSWADSSLEGETATALIADGCVLISQHADTTGAPSVCETKGVPVVGYNVDMTAVAPKTALTSPTNNWGVYYKYAIGCLLDGTKMEADWCKGYAEDAVGITTLGTACAKGTQEKVDETVKAIRDGSLHVFDTSKFTVGGKTVDTWKNKAGVEYIKDGYFHESEGISAPAFELRIDGITEK
ncbi:MAG: BMP family ABC transporter substrate-binding protein [bacterium]|nr:BMP family ABC transporter substrate-binding protein [bacterium]